ncbi:MAG: hypothetical protein H0V29_04995, partial [Thermoleophilaceae bacterium]|nr:hypothetical protein [Thermoleophilaceae bacterium]
MWGREIGSLDLDTSAGPSWKPLPVFLTTPFSAFGDEAGAWLWLAFARFSALAAVAGVAELVRREAGRGGAALVAALVVLSPWWFFNGTLGNSEPLLVALIAWAAVAHRADRVPLALGLGFAAALLRPEVWPFLLGYVVWLERRGSVSRGTIAAGGVALLALWTLPDLAGSDWDVSRAFGERGSDSTGEAAMADVPFLAVLEDLLSQATAPVVLAAAIAAFALPAARLWAGFGAAWALLVAAMAQAGLPN